jgi:perosamine synthetase
VKRAVPNAIPHSRPTIGEAECDGVLETMRKSWVGSGGETADRLARELADFLRRASAAPVSSGTSALEIALRIIGVERAAVAMPAFSCASIERAIVRAGGVPLLIDVDRTDLSFPPGALEPLSSACAAIVLVHQFGIPASAAPALLKLPVPVVEDVTTAIGGRMAGRPVGTFGRLTVLSMAATKMLCAGEGGAVAGEATDIERLMEWTNPESRLPIDAPVPNAKLSAMACALASVQLRRLPEFLARRAEIASHYDDVLGDRSEHVVRPGSDDRGTWWRYLIMAPDADAQAVVDRACARGVTFARPVSERRWATRGRFPVSDSIHARLVSVPIFPSLTDSEVERVATTLDKAIKRR